MRKRLLRYLGALIVSMVCTYSGMQRFALADTRPSCSLSDVAAWQVALEEPDEEATPAYRQAVTEAFLEDCPARPEAPDAHRIAGLAAAWDGNAEAAARHFEAMGHVEDAETLLMHAAVRFALGEDTAARDLRDDAIDFWMARLDRLGLADITVDERANGDLIHVEFLRTDPETVVSQLWIARPHDAAWPAALSVTSERQLNALFKLRAGEKAGALRHVRFYRCRSRKLLARTTETVKDDEVKSAATAALSAYLAAPDRPASEEINACLFDNHILPRISRTSSIPIQ